MDLLPDSASTRALVSLVLLVVGTVLAVVALRNRRWEVLGAVLCTTGVVGWSFASSAYDGPVLFVVVEDYGLHLGDLLSVPALLLVAWLSWRGARH